MQSPFYTQLGVWDIDTNAAASAPPYVRVLRQVQDKFTRQHGRPAFFKEELILEQSVYGIDLQLLRYQRQKSLQATSPRLQPSSGYMKGTSGGVVLLEDEWANAAYNMAMSRMSHGDEAYWRGRYEIQSEEREGVMKLKQGNTMKPARHRGGRPVPAGESQKQLMTETPDRFDIGYTTTFGSKPSVI